MPPTITECLLENIFLSTFTKPFTIFQLAGHNHCLSSNETISQFCQRGSSDAIGGHKPPGHNPLDQNPLSVARPDETLRTQPPVELEHNVRCRFLLQERGSES